MKHVYLLLFLFFVGLKPAQAVLPDGSPATDWTLDDLNGTTHNLFSILNSGKHVLIDFSATWCGPCWNYHNSGVMSTLHYLYGPNGSDEIRVFFIEGDTNTNLDCLYGLPTCQGGTQGNWVLNTPYPIINLTSPTVRQNYQITYYPTLYAIRHQDKRVFEVGQGTVGRWESWFFESFEMSFTAAITDNTCQGNGQIALTVTQGHGNKFYQWSNGGFTSTITNLNAGDYTCTITDSNGYFEETDEYTVDGVPELVITLDAQNNVACNGESNGSLEVSGGGGGTGGYSYAWSNGSTEQMITDLPIGDYTVTITDSYNCEVEETFTITQPEVLGSDSYPYDVPCNGTTGYVELSGFGGTGPYLYDMGGTPQADPFFYNLAAGSYNFNVTDVNGCTDAGSFVISTIPGPTAVAAAQGTLSCTTLQTTVTGNGSTTGQGITYLWTTQNGTIVSGANSLNAVVSAAGTYTLRVTNNQNCFSEASTTVNTTAVLPNIVVAQPSPLTCTFTQRTLDGTGTSTGSEYSYLWTTQDGNIVSGNTTLMPVVNEPGTYVLQVTNSNNGCISTRNVPVAEDAAAPEFSVTNGEITCTEQEVEICATVPQGTTIAWYRGNDTLTTNCIVVTEAGSYLAQVVGSNGCSSTRTSTVTASADLPQVSVATPEAVDCTQREISIVATLQGNPDDFNISWTTEDGNIVEGDNTLTPLVDRGGTYVLTVANPTNGCTTTRTVEVDENTNLPEAAFTSSQSGNELTLALNQETYNSLSWNLGNGQTSDQETVTISFENTGTYTICLTVVNDCGETTNCEDVLFVAPFSASLSAANIRCAGENSGSIKVTPKNGLPDYQISWTGPDGFTSTSLEITGLAPGVYTGVLTDAQGTEIVVTYEITAPAALTQSGIQVINETNNGANGSIEVEMQGGTAPYAYAWSNGANTQRVSNLKAGSYTVTVTDANGCAKVLGPFVVENSTASEDIISFSNFSLSPNPANQFVQISAKWNQIAGQKVTMKVYNAVGQVMTKQMFQQEINTALDVTTYQQGLYFLELSTQDNIMTKKFFVVH